MSSSKSASGSAQPLPASRPRIPETFLEVPDQRRYAVSLGVLCLVCDHLVAHPVHPHRANDYLEIGPQYLWQFCLQWTWTGLVEYHACSADPLTL